MAPRAPFRLPARRPVERAVIVPPDPRPIVEGPLDPALQAIRAGLAPHRRRLWLRRIVRRGWIALAAIVGAEVVLWTVARFIPLEAAPILGVAIPVLGLVALLVAVVRARPALGETALAVDAEGVLGDRVSSALELAAAFPAAAGPSTEPADVDASDMPPGDDAAEAERFVRRQRRDALAALRIVPPNLFRPRFSQAPALTAFVAALALVAVLVIPNPQDAVIATNQQVREEANRQAERIEEIAEELESEGRNADDPRSQLAEELRELVRQLRDRPAELDDNLARIAATESRVRAQLDPANEQRAASLTSLSRSLSRASASP